MWLLFRSSTIHLGIVSCILSWIFEGDGITSQMEGYFSVLLFSILLYHTGLKCLVVFCFLYCFYNWSFWKTLWRKLFLVRRFFIVLALQIYCVSSMLKRRGHYLKTWCPRCWDVEYTWSVCRNLAGGFPSTDIFWRIWLFFTQ